MKKKYYQLALIHHPDRVVEGKKEEAKHDFHLIHQAYSILSDAEKKQAYDNGLDVFFTRATVTTQWESHLRAINVDDFENGRKHYQGTEREEMDILREYTRGNGSITHILNNLPFMRIEDESRVIAIIQRHMNEKTLPKKAIKKISRK